MDWGRNDRFDYLLIVCKIKMIHKENRYQSGSDLPDYGDYGYFP